MNQPARTAADTGPTTPVWLRQRAIDVLGTKRGRIWSDVAPQLLTQAAARWQLTLDDPIEGGRASLLHRAHSTTTGQRYVIKLPLTDPQRHADGQQHLHDAAAGPPLVQYAPDLGVLLLEQLQAAPITSHWHAGHKHAAHVIRLLKQVAATPARTSLPPLENWIRKRLHTAADTDSHNHSRCATALQWLDRTDQPNTPIHGDARPDNILTDQDNTLWLIDARGVNGDLHFDVATFLYKTAVSPHDLPADAQQAAADTDIDLARVSRWMQIIDICGL